MSPLRQIVVIAGLALLPALGSGWWLQTQFAAGAALRAHEVTIEGVAAWNGPVLWIDARPPESFARDHVPGALPLDELNWEEQLVAVMEAWLPEQRIVVYCDATGCSTSARVAERLRGALGTQDVYYLRGGFAAWKREN